VRTLIATLLIVTNPVFIIVGLMLYATTRAGK